MLLYPEKFYQSKFDFDRPKMIVSVIPVNPAQLPRQDNAWKKTEKDENVYSFNDDPDLVGYSDYEQLFNKQRTLGTKFVDRDFPPNINSLAKTQYKK